MKNIANKIIPRKEKSFTHYIQLFDKSETKGIVPKDSLDSEVPNEFLNSSGNLDFYVAMHAIAKDQNKFFNYYHEVKTALQIYDDLPVSCEEIYNERKGSSEYITSILWTVYACLTSGSTVTILARAEYMEELLKITFLSKSESNFSLGSRILKAIIATQHSPQTLSAIWDKLPNINTNDSKVDFIEFLLRRIGKSVYWYGYKDSTKRLFRLGYEAYGLLLSLMNVDRWKVEIVTTILSGLKEASESLKLGKVLSQHTIGSIKILSSLVKGSSFFDRNLIEFVTANVNHAANKAIIKSIDGDNVICYASTTDEVFTIPKSDVIKISLPAKVDVLELLTQDEIHALQVSTAEVWFSLEQSVSAPLSIRAERVASIRILYSQLENVIVNVISSILFKKSSVSENEVVDLLRVIMKNSKNTGRFVGKLERELLIREILKTMAEQPIFEDFTDEEIAEKFSSLGITAKNIVEELLKENFPVMKLAKCIDRGIKDKNSILSFVDESDEKKSDLLFKLNQLELKDFTVTDVAEQADLYQNSTAQLVIENKNYTTTRKEITTQPELSYFRKPKQFIKELTILAVLEATAYKNQVHFGLKLGNLEIAVSTNSGRPNFEINGNCLCEVKINEQLAIRVHVDPNGSITVINDNQKESLEIQDSSVFNGLRMGAYGLFMNTGERSSLMIFEVYEGKYTGAIQSKPVKPKDADNFKQVKVNVRDENLDKFRLKLLGLTDDQVNDTLSNSQDLRSGLDYVSKHYPNHFQNALTSLNQDAITDVRFVKTNREVPNGFTVVPVLEEGKIKEFNIPRKMMLIFKREQVTTGKVISKIIIGREETEFTDIGDFDLEEPNPMTHVWTKQVDFEKDSGLKDLIYIKSTSMYNVKVPFGYTLLSDKEGNIVNLAHNIGKKNFMFLAVKSGDTILNVQLNAMKKQLKHSVSFGIVDDFEIVQAEGKIDDNIFESQSIQELFNHYFEFSELDKQISYKNLTLSLIKKCPIVLTSIAQEYSISKLFDFLGQDLNKISKEVDSNIKTDNPIFREKILRDSLAKLLKSLIGDGGSCGPLLPIMIESPTHPYECNLDIDLEIKIPGASSLKIVFDPQTHTESSCDPLRFYKSSGRVEELKCLSGSPGESSWPTFEVEGDTVHMYFHSDGSVVYWGYKFDVIPIGGSGKGQGENPAPALWVFEKLAGLKQLPQDIVEIVSGKVVQPLFLCGIGAADFNQKLDAVNILRKVIRDQKGPPFKNILNMLMIQMNELHKECINSKNENKLLQALTNLMEETSQRFQLAGEELWFMEFCELVSDIKGLAQKDGFLDTLLFESFKKDINCSLDKVYESSHPYIRKTKKERIQIPGSAFMRITFDSNSELNPRDGVIFSYDEAGRNLVEEPKVEVTESPAR